MPKLTTDEFAGLGRSFNIADAHARANPSASEDARVIRMLPTIFDEARRVSAREADIRGASAFAAVSCQPTSDPDQALPVYASSIAIEIIANVLCVSKKKVILIEPTFDNIPDILKRNRIQVNAIRIDTADGYLVSLLEGLAHCKRGDVLFIVSPNNPTGQTIAADELKELCNMCALLGVDLIIDASFRLFEEKACYDHYSILQDSAIGYMCIEDSGKYWPSLDVKLAYIYCSDSWRQQVKFVYDDFLLNVSPFISLIVEAYSKLYLERGLSELRAPISINRAILRNIIKDGGANLTLPFESSSVSVELVRLPASSAREVVEDCRLRDVSVLSGQAFYWADKESGNDLLRVALFRDSRMFGEASRLLLAAIAARTAH